MIALIQPIDGRYFLTSYFIKSTILVLLMVAYTAWTALKRR